MKRRVYLFLFIAGILVVLVPAWFQEAPGYMDADYYFLGGFNLASGEGLSEWVLWNYLDDPEGLPNPSHAYWMPLTSLVAGLGVFFSPSPHTIPLDGFLGARLGFIVIAGLIPPLTAWFAFTLRGKPQDGWVAGLLAVFSGFYLPFLPTTDTFGIYMVLGALILQMAWLSFGLVSPVETAKRRSWGSIIIGLIAGAMHLSRADGLIWLGIAVLSPVLGHFCGMMDPLKPGSRSVLVRNLAADLLRIFLGYFVVMGPWIVRNLNTFGTLLSPGGLRTLWLIHYDDLFLYPVDLLNLDRWWASGLSAIAQVRVAALGTNLGTALAVQGMIFLAPLGLLGLWHLRRDIRVQLGGLGWLLTFLAMTVFFPEPGARGGFFHSGAALQILFWAVVPTGLQEGVTWVGRRRRWQIDRAIRVFQAGLVMLAFGLTAVLVRQRVVGQPGSIGWNASAKNYSAISQALRAAGGSGEEVVLVNNPPGYHLVSGEPAIVIPMGDMSTLLAVAKRYDAHFLVLEPNHPAPLNDLYVNPQGAGELNYLMTIDETHLFRVD